jgi:hypothetical protein
MRGDVAEEAQDPRLVAPLLLSLREVEGAPPSRACRSSPALSGGSASRRS